MSLLKSLNIIKQHFPFSGIVACYNCSVDNLPLVTLVSHIASGSKWVLGCDIYTLTSWNTILKSTTAVCLFRLYFMFIDINPATNGSMSTLLLLLLVLQFCPATSPLPPTSLLLLLSMMTSSYGNISRVTGHLCGEFTGPRWIPHTKTSDVELWCFLWSPSE